MPRLPITGATATHITLNGREILSFGGCNYLGLAQHTDVIRAAAAAEQIARHAPRGIAVFTDGIFTADGGLAPVPGLLAALPARGATLVVDDCHGFCVMGPRGAGTLSHFQINDPRVVLTTTL